MRSIGAILAMALAGGAPAAAAGPIHQTLPPLSSGRMVAAPLSTQVFLSKVENAAQFELQAAQLAMERSQNPALKQLADRMIKDQTAASEDLKKAVAGDAGAELPNDAAISGEMALKLKQLQGAWGKWFDMKFIEIMADGRKKDADLFRYYDANGSDAAVKIFARKTLPVIESHLRDLEALEKAAKAN